MSDSIEMQEITLRAVLQGLEHFVIHPSRLTTLNSSHIGSGGYGEVILAKLDESELSAREVAVKQLRTVGTNGVRIRVALRLARELKIWAKVKHPNILGLIGYYLSENYEVAQLVSPFMVNGNVLKYIAELRPDTTKRLDFVRDITAGMGYLHSRDPPICHGDLKPANVLIDDSTHAVLCDFGLASIADEAYTSSGLTTSQSLKGSTRYMSPELVTGEEPKQTLASDMWAWACTVFQVLTDVEPYSDAMREYTVIAAIVQRKPPTDLTMLSNGVLGRHIEELRIPLPDHLASCLSYEPEERPPIADSFRLICMHQQQPVGSWGTVAGVPQTFSEEKTLKLNEVWDALKQHPRFEESDVDELCRELSSKASLRWDGGMPGLDQFDKPYEEPEEAKTARRVGQRQRVIQSFGTGGLPESTMSRSPPIASTNTVSPNMLSDFSLVGNPPYNSYLPFSIPQSASSTTSQFTMLSQWATTTDFGFDSRRPSLGATHSSSASNAASSFMSGSSSNMGTRPSQGANGSTPFMVDQSSETTDSWLAAAFEMLSPNSQSANGSTPIMVDQSGAGLPKATDLWMAGAFEMPSPNSQLLSFLSDDGVSFSPNSYLNIPDKE
ncbi:hypothetical protein FRC04_012019 [Tulasnella sp. 424]|nr:hypothetical protein FRC04_012019 [Tulasnella sp. 424]